MGGDGDWAVDSVVVERVVVRHWDDVPAVKWYDRFGIVRDQ